MNFSARLERNLRSLEKLLDPNLLGRGYLNRVAYPEIIKYQAKRFQTENVSVTGAPWTPLNPKYRERKIKQAARFGWPRGGQSIGVRTGRLFRSITGLDKSEHYKLVTDRTLETGTMVEYAGYFNESRDIVELSDKMLDDLAGGLARYLASQIKG